MDELKKIRDRGCFSEGFFFFKKNQKSLETARRVNGGFWKLPLCDVTKGSEATTRLVRAAQARCLVVTQPNDFPAEGSNGGTMREKLKLFF